MRRLRFALAVVALAAAPLSLLYAQRLTSSGGPADLIVWNGRIYTVDDSHPFVEALAVRDGRVLFVGSRQEALTLRGPATRMLDLGGRTVIPGMVDAHAHIENLGVSLRTVGLSDTHSYDEVVARVVARANDIPAGQWIIGRGWDQNKWGDTRFPTHDALSRAVPNNPVALTRIDGHAILANAAAMRAANVTAATKDPAGGRIERTASGEPT